MERTAEYIRKTKETDIKINLNIDGTGKAEIDTGIGFFDHMLEGFARHGFFDLDVKVEGDLAVDCHHTIEDTGIVLGNAIRKALKNKRASNVLEAVFCRWMRHWCSAPWISPADLILFLMANLLWSA